VNTVAAAALFVVFREVGWMPHLGIAVATVIGGWLNAGLLMALLMRRRQFVPDSQLIRAAPKIIVASAVMGAALFATAYQLEAYLSRTSGPLIQLAALSVLVGTGVVVYFAFCHLTGAARLNQLLAAMRRGG
jgi:putative peptidoglycan lipid II flippase